MWDIGLLRSTRAGQRRVYWDGRNEVGESVASGIYFYHLSAGDYSATRRNGNPKVRSCLQSSFDFWQLVPGIFDLPI